MKRLVSITKKHRAFRSLDDAKRWFQGAQFGLFVHWGLYSLLAGEWRGKQIRWLGEWVMHTAKISIREYEPLARLFNPNRFDARECSGSKSPHSSR